MRRAMPVLLVVGAAIALVIWLDGRQPPHTLPPIDTAEDHRSTLKKQIAEQTVESDRSVAEYVPTRQDGIDDVNAPVHVLLQQLPGVAEVERRLPVEAPTNRIIHLRNWHWIPKEHFVIDVRSSDPELDTDEIDRLYEEFLHEVELVQVEQMALLRCLIKHHGLTKVFSEGFSPSEVEAYQVKIAGLKAMEADQVPRVRKQLEEVRKLLADVTGDQMENAKAIEAQLLALLDEHKQRMLEVGAAGRLLISGELEAVLPLEGEGFEKLKPITSSGELDFDPEKMEARHDAQVQAAIKEEPVAVIVLGGAHDLADAVKRVGGEKCEYLRVTTKTYREMAQ